MKKAALAAVMLGMFLGGAIGGWRAATWRSANASDSRMVDITTPVSVTNYVSAKRIVTLTNFVQRTVTVTNTVTVKCVEPRRLTKRKTAAYTVSAKAMRGTELNKFLRASGARILECDPGAVAIVEAPDGVVDTLMMSGLVTVNQLKAKSKIIGDVEGDIKVYPLSSMDFKSVADAITALGGKIKVAQEPTGGKFMLACDLSLESILELAARADVRKIEKNDKKK